MFVSLSPSISLYLCFEILLRFPSSHETTLLVLKHFLSVDTKYIYICMRTLRENAHINTLQSPVAVKLGSADDCIRSTGLGPKANVTIVVRSHAVDRATLSYDIVSAHILIIDRANCQQREPLT